MGTHTRYWTSKRTNGMSRYSFRIYILTSVILPDSHHCSSERDAEI